MRRHHHLALLLLEACVCSFAASSLVEISGFHCMMRHSMRLNRRIHGTPQEGNPPFDLRVYDQTGRETVYYEPDKTYTVRLVGFKHYRGVLLQARLCDASGFLIGSLKGGRFMEDSSWDNYGIRLQQCDPHMQTNDSVTHADDSRKFLTQMHWTTNEDVGNVQFMVTICEENEVCWERWRPRAGFLQPLSRKLSPQPIIEQVFTDEKAALKLAETQQRFERLLNDRFGVSKIWMPPRLMRPSAQSQTEDSTTKRVTSTEVVTVTTSSSAPSTTATVPSSSNNSYTEKQSLHFRDIEKAFTDELSTIERKQKPNGGSTEVFSSSQESSASRKLTEGIPARVTSSPRVQFHELRNEAIHYHPVPVGELKSADVISSSETEDSCSSHPCKNGGECFNLESSKSGFRCVCKGPWTGSTCDLVDFCGKNQCQHGSCVNAPETPEKYRCVCNKDFAGKTCNRPCENICQHNGTCYETSEGQLRCACPSGASGKFCENNINECNQLKCRNRAKCVDLWNDYKCICPPGWMGKNCDRPCQDVYKSCKQWKRQNQCELMRPTTDFFDKNCAVSCGQCKHLKSTIMTDKPLAPVLLPLAFLLGVWKTNVTGNRNETTDYPVNFMCGGYEETLYVTVTEVMMFGTPSINFTSVAVNQNDPEDRHIMNGFLTIRQYPEDNQIAALTTVSNTGLQMIEEGTITNGKSITFLHKHVKALSEIRGQIPEWMERTFARNGAHLVQSISKRMPDGRNRHLTKQYEKVESIRYL